jgi:hypothetical protein
MEAAEINFKLENVNKKLDKLEREYMRKTIQEIILLPEQNQQKYWNKINIINDYLDASFVFTQELINEVNQRKSAKEVQFLKNHIKVLKKYIEVLGGNPSNCNFA